MNLKLSGLCFSMIFQSSTVAASTAYNPKILDLEATAFVSQSSYNQEISIDTIKRSLTFVYDENLTEKKYGQPSEFQALCTKISELIDSSLVKKSFENCKTIYEEGDKREKISIHIFLEEVYKKYFEFKQTIQRSNKTLEKKAPHVYSDKDDVFKSFFDGYPQKVK